MHSTGLECVDGFYLVGNESKTGIDLAILKLIFFKISCEKHDLSTVKVLKINIALCTGFSLLFLIFLGMKQDNERFYKRECINRTSLYNYLDTVNIFYCDVPEDKEMYCSRYEDKTSKYGRVKNVLETKKRKES